MIAYDCLIDYIDKLKVCMEGPFAHGDADGVCGNDDIEAIRLFCMAARRNPSWWRNIENNTGKYGCGRRQLDGR